MASEKAQMLFLILFIVRNTEAVEYMVYPIPCPPETSCRTLQNYMQNADDYFRSFSTFVFQDGEHQLDTRLVLHDVTDITFKGMTTSGSQILVSPEAGIFFYNSANIEFSSMTVTNSGQENDTTNIALKFNFSISIQLNNVKFTHLNPGQSRSRAIFFTDSFAEITNCSFHNGYIKNGGVIETYNSELNFDGKTIFENNTADFSGGSIYADSSVLTFNSNTIFTKNSAGTSYYPSNYDIGGGAICALKTSITFSNYTEFTDNGPILSLNVLIGSAILAGEDSTLTISGSSVFRNNSGHSGGGLFLVNSTLFLSGQSNFLKNYATTKFGGAIFAHRSTLQFSGSLEFMENYAVEIGGAIFLEQSSSTFGGLVNFSRNFVTFYGGGAISIFNSLLEVSGIINYYENKATFGGALSFIGNSHIQLESPVNVTFFRNEASYGGAIEFVDSIPVYAALCQNVSVESSDCFFRVQAQDTSFADINLNFIENYVKYSGASIYGGALELCKIKVNGVQTEINGYHFLQNVSVFIHRNDTNSFISSFPLKVCRCINGKKDCSSDARSINITTVPGKTFDISVLTVGQLSMPEPSNIVNIFVSSNGSEIRPQSYNANKTTQCHDVGFQLLTNNPTENIQIYPEGCNSQNGSLLIRVTLEECPPGFILIKRSCDCEERLQSITEKGDCDIKTGLIKRPQNAWIKPVYTNQTYVGFIWSPNCFTPYCKVEDPLNPTLLNFSSLDTDNQCTPNRTGILCGSCTKNHSVVMHSLQCNLCQDHFMSLIIFFFLAGIALISILLLLQMTVAKGTINGLILYCNYVNICSPFFFPLDRTSVTPLSIFIAWVNLDFGIPTCFYNGLDSYSYQWLQFVFPFYLWLLIGTIIIACNISSRVGSLFGSNPIAVLATIILMSFTKLLQTTVDSLSSHVLENPDGGEFRQWRGDPNIPYFGGKHTPLVVVSILIIIFLLVPYIFLLLFGYRLLKFSNKKGFRWFNKFKPLLDAYYAPYTKNGRYWPGLMVLIRACLFLSFTITPLYENNASLIVSSSLFIAVATLAWVSGPVYENIGVEVLEASFILNICVLPIASYHIFVVGEGQLHVTYASVGIAFTEFIGIVMFHVFLRILSINYFKNIHTKYYKYFKKLLLKTKKTKQHSSEVNATELGPEETAAVAIREPLLEDATDV